MRLHGKTAIVTGGAQGIGREYAARFAREGANVVITDIREEQAQRVAREISQQEGGKGGKVVAIKSDVTSQEEMNSAAAFANREFGHIDVLMNNAAIYYDLDCANQSIEYGRKVLDVNLFGIIIAARAVFPYMKKQRGGALINIATIGAWPPEGLGGANRSNAPDYETVPVFYYGLAKSGVVWLTKTMAIDLGRYGIRVNAIAPGSSRIGCDHKDHVVGGDGEFQPHERAREIPATLRSHGDRRFSSLGGFGINDRASADSGRRPDHADLIIATNEDVSCGLHDITLVSGNLTRSLE